MLQIRKAAERGQADYGWLQTSHTFSFASYHDPRHMRFRALRVMNEDIVAPGGGFDTHPHHDMEIVTYVLSGAIEHRDSMGNGEILHAGELQRMSAGTGITHSEFNPSATDPLHLYQIWLFPERKGIQPGYEQRRFPVEERRNRLQLVVSRRPDGDALLIHQDAQIYLADLEPGTQLDHELAAERHAWLQVLRGSLTLNELPLEISDGVAISEQTRLSLTTRDGAEIMLFDVA